MVFSLIVLCLLLIFAELITLYKANKKQELKIYITTTIILLIVSSLEYLQLIPRHLMKTLSSFFLGNK